MDRRRRPHRRGAHRPAGQARPARARDRRQSQVGPAREGPFHPQHLFLVAHGIDQDEQGEIVDREVHLFAGQGLYVATVRREPRFDSAKVAARLESAPELSEEGIGFLLYLMLDEIVDGHLNVIERFETRPTTSRTTWRPRRRGRRATRSLAKRIFRVRQQVVRFRRLAALMREVGGPPGRDAGDRDARARAVLPRRPGSRNPRDGTHRQRPEPAHLGTELQLTQLPTGRTS